MKKTTLLSVLLMIMGIAVCKANIKTARPVYQSQTNADTLAIYTGKFQRVIHNDMFYLQFDVVDGNLIGTTLWDGNKLLLKHLSGDNFIVSGIDWSVKFIRDKDGKVTEVSVRGNDHWIKVKN